MNDNASFLVLFLAPVKEYLADDKVSEILINGPSQIYIERNGKLEETGASFASEAQLKAAAVNIAKSVDRQLDEMHPDLDARLPDGSRVHATIPPISRCGTILSIRKFKKEMLTMEKLEEYGSVPLYCTGRFEQRGRNCLHSRIVLHGRCSVNLDKKNKYTVYTLPKENK